MWLAYYDIAPIEVGFTLRFNVASLDLILKQVPSTLAFQNATNNVISSIL